MKRFLGLMAVLFLPLSLQANPEDFTVKAATGGDSFTLSSARGKFVALHFLLKTECPICLRHTRDYLAKSPSLPNVVQVFLKPDDKKDIAAWATKLPEEELAKTPIYRDADAEVAEAFGIPGGYKFHGQEVHYPALVLIDPAGKEVFRYVGKNNSDRVPFETLALKVAELTKAPQ